MVDRVTGNRDFFPLPKGDLSGEPVHEQFFKTETRNSRIVFVYHCIAGELFRL